MDKWRRSNLLLAKTSIRPPMSVSKKNGFASFSKVCSGEKQGTRTTWRGGCTCMNPEVFKSGAMIAQRQRDR